MDCLVENTINEVISATEEQRVKIFVMHDPSEAEKLINQWLQKNNVSIHHIGQSQSEKGGKFIFTLSVFFSNKE